MPAVNGTEVSGNIPVPNDVPVQKKGSKSVETVYQKKTQLEHILLRPDTYIGSVEFTTEQMWVLDLEEQKIVQREISFVPGLYKIFDEILVNAADNKQRDPKMDTIKVDIDGENNVISIYNNGKGIPVAMHKDEKMYVPTMIFGHLLTSSNYNDEEQKVTGGRNGYGAKLCNIFSNKFTVETSSEEYKKTFKQTWGSNMSKTSDPKIKPSYGEDYTKVTFSPDLVKFKMESLNADIISLLSRRAYDVAASTRGVKVFLNGKRVPVKNFKDYVDLFLKDKVDDADNPVKAVYESVNERWEVAVALSDKGFQQMSFVNSIATTKGGRHTDYVADSIVKNLIENLKKKNKSGVQIKPFQIKNHMWLFVNCLIVNPTFDSQTKENMTLQAKSFGSKCSLSEKFLTSVSKCGIVESVMAWAKFKQQAQLQKVCTSKKQNKIKGLPKLEDANDAGTRYSSDCTLILTEGDSAKTLAVAGLGVVGRDRYGVFPLRGKLLNVREASHKQILENAEINNIIKILGLQYKKKYETPDDMKTLRYGKLMIMTDQDQDGSHIKGLLINFIHHNWPTLIRNTFMEEFITPIVKASKNKEEYSFYSLPEFEEWKKEKDNWHTYKIKYYKGLGTSTSKEAKEYFQEMSRHRIRFSYSGAQDDHSITMAFSKKAVDQRKEWLTGWMEECKRRKELGLPEVYLYEKDTRAVTYSDFVNKELVLFSNCDNERSIPSLVDGLKPGQRKVMYTCMKRNDKREVKVAQLAGSVAEHSAYHHGENSLMSTIINLAQNFVGSNNINLLQPIGQFGTRLQGGKDAASPRYIFTKLSPLTRLIFNPYDDPLLKKNYDDNKPIEPEWYIPIIPMVLVNGADGIGTGWSTRIPNYNPREIVNNLRKMIRGEEPSRMKPWFKNFKGTIDELDHQRYIVHGEISQLGDNKVEITELPVRVWTQVYKETVLEALITHTEKNPAYITEYREYNTDTTIRFTVTMSPEKYQKALDEGIHKVFKLQGSLGTTSMVMFDHNGVLRKYDSVEDIMREFFELRLKFYGKRKAYLVGMLEAEANKLSNQARFILEKCDGRLVVENKKKKDMIEELQRKGYDSDPVKSWKKQQETTEEEEGSSDSDSEEFGSQKEEVSSGPDYDYLLGMAMWNLTKEKKDELLKNKDKKNHELNCLKVKTPEDLWNADLDEFSAQLDAVEEQERLDEQQSLDGKKATGKGKGSKKVKVETMPSPFGERVVPRIDADLKRKAEKAAAAKENRGKKAKKENVDADDYDDLVSANTGKSLASRLGNSPDMILKAAKAKKVDASKQPKPKGSPKKKGKNPWDTDSDDDPDNLSDLDDDMVEVQPRERASGRRAAASNVKFKFDDDDDDSGSDVSLHDNEGIEEPDIVQQQLSFVDDSISVMEEVEGSDTDSELGAKPAKTIGKPANTDKPTASDLFDSMLSGSPSPPKYQPAKSNTLKRTVSDGDSSDYEEPKPKKMSSTTAFGEDSKQKKRGRPKKSADELGDGVSKPKKKPVPKKKAYLDSSDNEEPKPKKKPGPKKTAAAKKKMDSDSDDDMFDSSEKQDEGSMSADVIPREKSGRQKKAVKYALSDDDSDSDF
ncbi:DNA topoisomerase 2-alpha isoform X2 [Macrobrachium rosenbergii]|uniref:DNA topoisomerase 2-alpha isoform X2 n=1 Tax=Macrobrachium rosenbergii TaxID=79674 RepID=UPI0034D72C6F